MDRPPIEDREVIRAASLAVALTLVASMSTSCRPVRPSHLAAASETTATRSFGCLDLSLAATRSSELPPSSLLVDLEVDNRCHEPVPFDLRALRMWTEHRNGDRFWMTLYDPRSEIGAVHVEGDAHGVEHVRCDDAGPAGAIRRVCFDLSGVSSRSTEPMAPLCRSFEHEPIPPISSDDVQPEPEPRTTEEVEP